MAPPVPTAEDYAAAAAMHQHDVTAPPTAGGLFPTGGFSLGSSAASTSQPYSSGDELSLSDPYLETDGTTTFRTESTRTSDASTKSSSSSFWPSFGR
jgi:hypothetical protein